MNDFSPLKCGRLSIDRSCLLVVVLFWCGRNTYRIYKPAGNIVCRICACVWVSVFPWLPGSDLALLSAPPEQYWPIMLPCDHIISHTPILYILLPTCDYRTSSHGLSLAGLQSILAPRNSPNIQPVSASNLIMVTIIPIFTRYVLSGQAWTRTCVLIYTSGTMTCMVLPLWRFQMQCVHWSSDKLNDYYVNNVEKAML